MKEEHTLDKEEGERVKKRKIKTLFLNGTFFK